MRVPEPPRKSRCQMASGAGARTAVLPSLAHLSPADFAHVYEPQEDTWLLCDALLRNEALLRATAPTVAVEIGPGSGTVCTYLAALLCRPVTDPAAPPLPPPFVLACDLNPRACAATAATAAANGVGAAVDALRCDLVGPLAARLAGAVDMLLFNPPYVPSEEDDIPAPYAPAAAAAARAAAAAASGTGGGGPPAWLGTSHCANVSSTPDDGAASAGDGRETAHGGRPADGSSPSLEGSGTAAGAGGAGGGELLDAARERALAAGAWAGGPDGRVVIDRVLPLVPTLLARPGGLMYMVVVDENRPADIARSLATHGLVTARVAAVKAANERLSILRVGWRENARLPQVPRA